MPRTFTTEIPGTECLGDSRGRINTNFLNLDNNIQTLSAQNIDQQADINDLVTQLPDPVNLVTTVEAGDGILVNNQSGIVGTSNVTVAAYNSIHHVRYGDFATVANTAIGTIPNYALDDGTTMNFYRFPINTAQPPALVFDSVAKGTKIPTVSLYWVASAAIPTTVYATNSSVNTRALGRTYPNNTMYTIHRDNNTAYLGGAFTRLGNTIRRYFGVIDLNGAPTTTTGPVGSLGTVPGTGGVGEVERNFLNSVGSAGFNGGIFAIQTFNIGTKKYLCVGGDFTNAPAGDSTGTTLGQRFAIFDMTDNFNTTHTFTLNNRVTTMLSADQYLYVGGWFTAGRRNTGATNISMKGLTRINMNDLTIDTVFTQNAASNTTGILGGSIFTLEISNNYLYTGGNHYARINRGNSTTHQYLMAHSLNGSDAGKVYSGWEPTLNGTVTTLKTDKVTKTLYVGGQFTRYKTFGTDNIVRNYVLALNASGTTPTLFNNWSPISNSYVNSIEIHNESDATSPVYLGGQFSRMNNQACGTLVALTKPETGNVAQLLTDWRLAVNSSFFWYTKPGIIRIPTTNALSGLLLHGSFTNINGGTRYYFGRVSGRGEGPTIPLSSVGWSVAGSVLAPGSQLSINVENAITTETNPLGFGTVNVTTITMPDAEFDGLNRGDLCRFLIRRPSTTDTFRRDVWLIGASVDYSPATITETI